MAAFFIGTDPANDLVVRQAFGTIGLNQAWGGGWVLVTTETLDEVTAVLTALNISSAVVFPFEGGQQITGFDHASRVLEEAVAQLDEGTAG